MTSFVWPFDRHRHARLAAALRVAADHPATIDTAAAGEWLVRQLHTEGSEHLTVVWHSVTQRYWPPEEVTRVAAVLDDHGRRRPLAEVSMEYAAAETAQKPEVRLRFWSGNGSPAEERLLGTAHDHGIPVWLSATQP